MLGVEGRRDRGRPCSSWWAGVNMACSTTLQELEEVKNWTKPGFDLEELSSAQTLEGICMDKAQQRTGFLYLWAFS